MEPKPKKALLLCENGPKSTGLGRLIASLFAKGDLALGQGNLRSIPTYALYTKLLHLIPPTAKKEAYHLLGFFGFQNTIFHT